MTQPKEERTTQPIYSGPIPQIKSYYDSPATKLMDEFDDSIILQDLGIIDINFHEEK